MKKRQHTKNKVSIFVVVPLILISLFVVAATIFKITEIIIANQNSSNNFNKLEISLKDVPIEEIDNSNKDTKYPDNSAILTVNNQPTFYENIEIKGRGNYTWTLPKKPYQLKFSEKTDLFNHGEARKWLLLASYLDPTHLRNDSALFLADQLNEGFVPKGEFIELYIDNQYHGLYYLTEKIEIGKKRVNLKHEDGILMELDNSYGSVDGCNYDTKNNCFVAKEASNENTKDTAIADFISSINSLHKAIKAKDYTSIEKNIDVDSFAKYYLLNEFTINPDAYSSSFFLYKDGPEDKVHAGPVWDFDISLGNNCWDVGGINSELVRSPFETMPLKHYVAHREITSATVPNYITTISTLIFNLMDVPEFENKVKEIYQETMSNKKEKLLDHIRSQAEYIRPAALRDQKRWKIKDNFDEKIDHLIDWVSKRFDHFEQTYGINSGPINTQVNPDPIPESQPLSEE